MTANDWPHRLKGHCTVTWEIDPSPKSGRCNLVLMPGKRLVYPGDLELADWDGNETPRGVLRFDDIEMDVASSRLRVKEGDGPQHVTLFVSSRGELRRFSDLR